jgi:hypothetical protein
MGTGLGCIMHCVVMGILMPLKNVGPQSWSNLIFQFYYIIGLMWRHLPSSRIKINVYSQIIISNLYKILPHRRSRLNFFKKKVLSRWRNHPPISPQDTQYVIQKLLTGACAYFSFLWSTVFSIFLFILYVFRCFTFLWENKCSIQPNAP